MALARSAAPAVLVEVSGGITLASVADYAAAGVDLISVGALTHSAPVLDLGLDLVTGLTVLLAIDVGNTETVIGLYAIDDGAPLPGGPVGSVSGPSRPRPGA